MNFKKYIIIMLIAVSVFGCASGRSGFGTGLTIVPEDPSRLDVAEDGSGDPAVGAGVESGQNLVERSGRSQIEGSGGVSDVQYSEDPDWNSGTDSEIDYGTNRNNGSEDSPDIQGNTGTQEVTVYVCGEVQNSGVYTLPSGSRIVDAVTAAGGFTIEACEGCVNLADFLFDGEMIDILSEDEFSSGTINYVPSYGNDQNARLPQGDMNTSDGLININTADAGVLKTLPGIGDSKANAIISYRQEHGFFTSIEDIMKINGIKEGVFNNIKDYITV